MPNPKITTLTTDDIRVIRSTILSRIWDMTKSIEECKKRLNVPSPEYIATRDQLQEIVRTKLPE